MKLQDRKQSKNVTGLTRMERYRQERERRQAYYAALDRMNQYATIDPSVSQGTMYPGTSITDFANENMVKSGTLGIDNGRYARFGTQYQTLGPPAGSKFASIKTKPGPIGQYASLPAEGMYSISFDPAHQAQMDAKLAGLKSDISEYARNPQVRNANNQMWADQGMTPSNLMGKSKGRKAQTIVDTILGEAKPGDFQDMLGIASVMSNRVAQTKQSWQSVVKAPGQFTAYNKALPPGVEQFHDMAVKALHQVMTQGPINNATYYATPEAVGNLPGQLAAVAQTQGHMYFSDPKNRAIGTTKGYIRPDATAVPATLASVNQSNFPARPEQIASNTMRPSVDVATTPEAIDRLSLAQMGSISPAADRFGQAPASPTAEPSIDRFGSMSFAPSGINVAGPYSPAPAPPQQTTPTTSRLAQSMSFTPSGPMTNDVYSPAGGFASIDPGAFSPVADPMNSQLASVAQAYADNPMPANPAPESYPDYQNSVASLKAEEAARNAQPTEMAFAPAAPQGAFARMSPEAMAPSPEYAGLTPNMAQAMPGAEWSSKFGTLQAPAPALPDPTQVADYNVADVMSPVPGAPVSSTVDPTGQFPDAPAAPSTWDKVKYAAKPMVKDAKLGMALAGPLGALIGPAVGLLGDKLGIGLSHLGPGFDNAVPQADRFSTGFGLSGIMSALSGPKGAQGFSLSNPGMSVTSLGNGQSLRRSEKFGWTEVVGPDGQVSGIKYDNTPSGFFGSLFGGLSKSMNDKFGGGISKAEHDKFSGKAGLW